MHSKQLQRQMRFVARTFRAAVELKHRPHGWTATALRPGERFIADGDDAAAALDALLTLLVATEADVTALALLEVAGEAG